MAIEYLKRGKSDAARAEEDAKTAAVVTATLQDIEARGDVAVRELANKFDGYDRESYRLSASEIAALMAEVSPEDMADIKFAQEQVRRFAQAQRDSLQDIEVETAGCDLGAQEYSGAICGLLCARGQVSNGRLSAYVRGHGQRCRGAADHCRHTAL